MILYYELNIACNFQRGEVEAIYPSYANHKSHHSWIRDKKYYEYLKSELAFPVSKVKWNEEPDRCTTMLSTELRKKLSFPSKKELQDHTDLMSRMLFGREHLYGGN